MRQIGTIQILLSGACFGFLGIFGKWAFARGLPSGEFLSLRFLLAAGVLGLVLALRAQGELRIGLAPACRALALGAAGYALFSSFYFLALTGLSASLTVLLLYTYPLWVTLGSWALFGERPTRPQWLALPLLVAGLLLLVWGEWQARSLTALLFGLGSAFFYAAYILASHRFLRGIAPFSSGFYVILGAGIALSILHLRSLPADPQLWAILLATSVVSTVLAISLFLAGLQKLSSNEASLLSLAEPFTAVLLAAWAFAERLAPAQWVGAALVLGGMALVARGARAHEA